MARGSILFLVAAAAMVLLASLGGCRGENHLEPHYWVKYTGLSPVTGQKDTLALFVETMQTADTTQVIYQSAALTLKYTLSKNPERAVRFHSPFHRNTRLTWEMDTTLLTEGEAQKLAVYNSGDGAVDGGVKHYWCPEYGVIAIYSEAWAALWLLQTNDLRKNRQIKEMVNAVLPPPQRLMIEE